MPYSAGALGPLEAHQPHQGNTRGDGPFRLPQDPNSLQITKGLRLIWPSVRHLDAEQDTHQLDGLALRHNCSSSAMEGQRSDLPTHLSQTTTQLLQKGAAFGCQRGGTERFVTNNPHPFGGGKCIFLSPTKNQCCFDILRLFWVVFLFSSRAYKTTLELASPTWLAEDLLFTR